MPWWNPFGETAGAADDAAAADGAAASAESAESGGGRARRSTLRKSRPTGEEGSYARLRPAIRADDPAFRRKVAAFQAQLDDPSLTIDDVVDQAGFTRHEKDLLYAASRAEDPTLHALQQDQRRRYQARLARGGGGFFPPAASSSTATTRGGGTSARHMEATWLAMCWFGVPAPPLPARRVTTAEAGENGDDKEDEEEDSLGFLDQYDLDSVAPDEDELDDEDGEDGVEAPGFDQLVAEHSRRRTAPRLLGGESAAAGDSDTDTDVDLDSGIIGAPGAPVRKRLVRLYGYQGAVLFDMYDRSSLVDAVMRLMGPTRSVSMGLHQQDSPRDYWNATFRTVIWSDPGVDAATKNYYLGRIQSIFRPDDAETYNRLFVFARDEYCPPGWNWQPPPAGTTKADWAAVPVRCVRTGEPDGDVAYLRLPGNATSLSANQYVEWFMLVARILTPGAGLAARDRRDAGVAAHCRFGLHLRGHASLATPGGVGFSPWSWDAVVATAVRAAAQGRSPAQVEFDVELLDERLVAVHLTGLNPTPGTGSLFDNAVPVAYRKETFRQDLARSITSLVEAATTDAEKVQLASVDVWPDGRFWDPEVWPVNVVGLPCNPSALRQIEVQPGTAAAAGQPSVMAIRPVYKRYVAHCGDGDAAVEVEFRLDEKVDDFRQRLRAAGMGDGDGDGPPPFNIDEDDLHIRQQYAIPEVAQQPDGRHEVSRHAHPNMTDDERKQANRPDFYFTPDTTEEEWLLICSQIVGPSIWLAKATHLGCWIDAPDYRTHRWGHRTKYRNLLPPSGYASAARAANANQGTAHATSDRAVQAAAAAAAAAWKAECDAVQRAIERGEVRDFLGRRLDETPPPPQSSIGGGVGGGSSSSIFTCGSVSVSAVPRDGGGGGSSLFGSGNTSRLFGQSSGSDVPGDGGGGGNNLFGSGNVSRMFGQGSGSGSDVPGDGGGGSSSLFDTGNVSRIFSRGSGSGVPSGSSSDDDGGGDRHSLFPGAFRSGIHTISEMARLERAMDGLYELALNRTVPCPYQGCRQWFGAGSRGGLHRHIREHFPHVGRRQCCFCNRRFAKDAADALKVRHMLEAHADLFAPAELTLEQEDGIGGDGGGGGGGEEDADALPSGEEPELPPLRGRDRAPRDASATNASDGPGSVSPIHPRTSPVRASPPQTPPKRRRGANSSARLRDDPSYRPGHSDGDTEDSGAESDGHSRHVAKKAKTGRSSGGARDSTYRPGRGDTSDDDEDFSAGGEGEEDDDEDQQRKRKRTPMQKGDPSYRPGRGDVAGAYEDDEDEELRRSAVPEWDQDPNDPRGRRKRVIREVWKVSAQGTTGKGTASMGTASKGKTAKGTTAKGTTAKGKAAAAARKRSPTPGPAARRAKTKPSPKETLAAKAVINASNAPEVRKRAPRAKAGKVSKAPDAKEPEAEEGLRRSGRTRRPPRKLE